MPTDRCNRPPPHQRRPRRQRRQARARRCAGRADMRLGVQRQDEFEINVISLIDVMLTLLMFFVMTPTFVQHAAMKVTLPESSETTQEAQQNPLVVMVSSDSRYYVDS